MLMEVKSHAKLFFISLKSALMREMVNKVSFVSNIIFMILNNASFLLVWAIFYSLKDSIGGYEFKDILILWGISSGTYGVAHICFNNTFSLYKIISEGKLDAFIVQPKNILFQTIIGLSISAIGDLLYAYILLFFIGFTLKNFIIYTVFLLLGGIIYTSIGIIYGSLSFYIGRSEEITNALTGMLLQFSTYPDSIFNDKIKIIFYTVIPAGFMVYLPFKIMLDFDIYKMGIFIGIALLFIGLAYIIFYKGLKRYSSSNLMSARI